ncbi:Uncharacterised protein [Cedecea neteri]|uniref:Uncharacterized protein n=1 Tax=Cedecea neteri TaxID=158822 RepID=A0A2X2SUS1_9ENTR|nr:Uncharacterised protein [Cedecea neteri]
MRRPHLVPLSDQVVAALREIQAVTGRYNLVFPGRNDITKPMSGSEYQPGTEKDWLSWEGYGARFQAYDEYDLARKGL